MKIIYFTACMFLLAFTTVSCSSDKEDVVSAVGNVEIYLIESFEKDGNSKRIIESSVVCEAEPFLTYDQLLSYNSSSHVFKIKDEAKSLFSTDNSTVHYAPFAVKANNEVIYTGYFWPEYSSQIINWVVASPLIAETNGLLKVELGYPASVVNEPIPDNRNDSKILDIFKRDGKLQ